VFIVTKVKEITEASASVGPLLATAVDSEKIMLLARKERGKSSFTKSVIFV